MVTGFEVHKVLAGIAGIDLNGFKSLQIRKGSHGAEEAITDE
jgi:hypothetical protein